MARHRKSRDRVDHPTWTVRCSCGQRAGIFWLTDLEGITYGADSFPMGGTWHEATPSYPMGVKLTNIVDEDWWRFVCGRCGRDWRGRHVQLAGLVSRARALGQDSACLEDMPSPEAAWRSGARHSSDRPNRWRGGNPETTYGEPWKW